MNGKKVTFVLRKQVNTEVTEMSFKHQQQTSELSLSIKAAYPDLPPPPALFTLKQFAARNPPFTEAALWNIRFKSKVRQSSTGPIKTNGAASAFITVGRKVLIDEQAFFAWVRQQSQGAE
jgi:hypothetical protein